MTTKTQTLLAQDMLALLPAFVEAGSQALSPTRLVTDRQRDLLKWTGTLRDLAHQLLKTSEAEARNLLLGEISLWAIAIMHTAYEMIEPATPQTKGD